MSLNSIRNFVTSSSLLILFTLCPAHDVLALDVKINEVYYDAPGADGGFEFVELFNSSDTTVSLSGYRLESGDGAGAGRWRLKWFGEREDVIAPRGRFLIGEKDVWPFPNRVIELGLENGPDAVRLKSPAGAVDVIGWGELSYAEYFVGSPAPDVAAGYSLGRSPDGADSGDNAVDFVPFSPPTPGVTNRPEIDVALEPVVVSVSQNYLQLGETVVARGTAINRGLSAIPSGDLFFQLWTVSVPSMPLPLGLEDDGAFDGPAVLVDSSPSIDPVEPEDSLSAALRWRGEQEGAYRLIYRARLDEDGVQGNDQAQAYVRIGTGPLLVSEVLYAPHPGEPEWVEIRVGEEEIDLNRYRLEDASGRAAQLTPWFPAYLSPQEFAVLTEDAAALLFLYPHLDPSRVFTFHPWPRLNNSMNVSLGVADRVVLRDDRGVVSDAMAYSGGDPSGYSIERRDTGVWSMESWNWGLSALVGGTPLATNSVFAGPSLDSQLQLSQTSWRRGGPGPERLTVSYRLAWERARVRLSVYDPRGRERVVLHNGESGARGAVDWDGDGSAGKPLPQGAYFILLDAQPASGEGRLQLRKAVVLH